MISENKRSEIEIIYQILYACRNDIKKTPLLHRTNLCFPHFVNYITYLQKKGFIGINNVGSSEIFRITSKGKNVLTDIKTVLDSMRL